VHKGVLHFCLLGEDRLSHAVIGVILAHGAQLHCV